MTLKFIAGVDQAREGTRQEAMIAGDDSRWSQLAGGSGAAEECATVRAHTHHSCALPSRTRRLHVLQLSYVAPSRTPPKPTPSARPVRPRGC